MKRNLLKKIQISYFIPFLILLFFWSSSSPYLLKFLGVETGYAYGITRGFLLAIMLIVAGYFSFRLLIVNLKKLKQEKAELHQALKKLENKLRYSFFFYKHEPEAFFVEISDSISSVLGYSKEDFVKDINSQNYKKLTEGVFERAKEYGEKDMIIPRYEVELYHKNGSVLKFEISESAIFDEEGNLVSVEGTASLLRNSNEFLENREILYSKVYEGLTDAILIIKNGKFIDFNEKAKQLFGLSAEDIIMSSPFSNKFSPVMQSDGVSSKEKAQTYLDTVLRKGQMTFEWIHLKKGKEPFLAEVTLKSIKISGDTLIIAKIVDLENKESKNIDSILLRNKFNLFCKYTKNAYVVIDNNGIIIEYNKEFSNLLINGIEKQKNLFEQLNNEEITEYIRKNISGDIPGTPLELTIEQKNYSLNIERLNSNLLMIVVSKNDETKFLNNVIKNSGAVIYKFNINNKKYEYISPSIEEVTGYTEQEFLSFTSIQLKELLHPDDIKNANTIFARFNSGIQKKASILYRLKNKEGKFIWISDSYNIVNQDGIDYIVGNVHDITSLVETKKSLTNNIRNLEKAINNIENGIVIYENNKLSYVNDTFTDITGYSFNELYTFTDIFDIAIPGEKERIEKELSQESVDLVSFWIRHKSGRQILITVKILQTQVSDDLITKYYIISEVPIGTSKTVKQKNKEFVLQKFLHIIKEKKPSKEQLQFLKILYDSPSAINELIETISSEQVLPADEGLSGFIAKIEKEIAQKLLNTDIDLIFVKDFTQNIKLNINKNQLQEVIEKIIDFILLKQQNSGTVEVEIKLSSINNKKAELKINLKTSKFEVNEQQIDVINNLLSNNPVDINVVEKEFMSFVEIGHNIAELGGRISFLKGRNNNKIFSIRINIEVNENNIQDIKGNISDLKVLLVEDNLFNQMVIQTMLSQYGCDIDVAENGLKAIEKLRIKQYDIMLLDVIMPEMNGLQTIENIRHKLKNENSDIPFIVVTGDININFKEYEQYGVKDVILKPFTSRQLLSSIVMALSSEILESEENQVVENVHNQSFNISSIEELANGNKDLKNKLITVFIEKYHKDIEDIKKAIEVNNYEQIYKTAHGLKPSFGYLKIHSAEKDLLEILSLAKEKANIEQINDKLQSIENEMKAVILNLENEIQ